MIIEIPDMGRLRISFKYEVQLMLHRAINPKANDSYGYPYKLKTRATIELEDQTEVDPKKKWKPIAGANSWKVEFTRKNKLVADKEQFGLFNLIEERKRALGRALCQGFSGYEKKGLRTLIWISLGAKGFKLISKIRKVELVKQ